ncbi:GFA family protein [Kiloniella laminariae]|uniref:GFA family protein n=1 Tax=Kiloniella laminariae TaxID=454162 RepID=A0ABT4LE95_9PROT|nr:GFA family protein [Kiloniella laminariae]MCZ4279419.1 GFA family protein [Kiloniella laminariae]
MTDKRQTYEAKCHCGKVHFKFRGEPVHTAIRCNCSMCRRKNAVMSTGCYSGDAFEIISGKDNLGTYLFGDRKVKHHFCTSCGIYTFHQMGRQQDHEEIELQGEFRVNLGCAEEIDLEKLSVRVFDGHDSWRFLN